jgi:hypothetical protein
MKSKVDKSKWVVSNICGIKPFETYPVCYMVEAGSEIEAKKECFKLHYGYTDDSKFGAADRKEFKAVKIDDLEVGEIF